ncbi:hypothetical protein [Clostridium perfringens]|uniref:hypothetical protein n=1 Tax=Clostridium perfringens TaxID=1502 RepID=UPI001B843742|nr:hypothetical protein [Clostridium perfringens]HBC2033287.1 hypothetical protein [Clostridium perfringens]HBC2056694.1 hypothetical protein [Clostridium perfringens]HBC2070814.1 hypothetical protein [Clostridium perfringens]
MNKKVFSLLAAGAITTSMLSGVVAHAAGVESPKSIDVTYDNQTVITDPDNPTAPEWQVAIPSGIHFTDDKTEMKADVALQNANGGEYAGTAQVKVKVESQNDYKLTKGSSEASYTLGYGNKTMSRSETEIGTLTSSNKEVAGLAKLGDTSRVNELGQHKDKLTYKVQKIN